MKVLGADSVMSNPIATISEVFFRAITVDDRRKYIVIVEDINH